MQYFFIAIKTHACYTFFVMKTNKPYTAMILDVVDSRKQENRLILQKHLKTVIALCNRLFVDSLDKEVIFSAGDEIQGLFHTPSGAYRYVLLFQKLIYPIVIRSGIGTGLLDYHTDWSSTELDGPAYHRARKAIDSIHEKETQCIFFEGLKMSRMYANTMMLAYQLVLQDLKPKTRIIYHMAEYLDPVLAPTSPIASEKGSLEEILMFQQNLCTTMLHSYREPLKINLEAIEPNIHLEYWRWGLSTKISRNISTYRQSIDQAYKAGHFSDLREIEFTLLRYLEEIEV
jgi:hypothetical protein